MHPIERLRYVARAGTAPDTFLVAESVPAFAAFARNPNAMLVSLKGLISRQPESPGLLCLAARMVHSLDAVAAGWEFADAMELDRTNDIAETIAITEAGGTDVIDSVATGLDGETGELVALCPAGTMAWIEAAREGGRSVAIVTPMGTRLPSMLWERFKRVHPRVAALEGSSSALEEPSSTLEVSSSVLGEFELIPASSFDDVIGPDGLTPLDGWRPDCPDVAEVARF